ncbi:hypothetical protein G6F31_015756 [Rhizopus arrhizus]|nr:hypothetical protein G6F31_015756 [Rhizopus arrhizus]
MAANTRWIKRCSHRRGCGSLDTGCAGTMAGCGAGAVCIGVAVGEGITRGDVAVSCSSAAQSWRLKLHSSSRPGVQLGSMPVLLRSRAGGSWISPVRSSGSSRIATVFITLPPTRYRVWSPPRLAATTTSQCDFQWPTEPLPSACTSPL